MNKTRYALAALCTLAVFFLSLSPLRLDDVFLYLTFGRRLFALGEFGPVDTLIFTIKDYHWELWHEWWAYVAYYSAYLAGGYEGLIILRGLLAAAITFIVWRACDRARLNPLLTLALLTAAVYAASPRIFRDRSSAFTDLFNILLLYALTDPRLQIGKRKWLLPGLFLVWIQIHSGYLVGWFFLGLFYLSHWWAWDWRARREWTAVFAACILITLINPAFLAGVWWPVKAIFGSDWGVLGAITEFQPTLTSQFLDGPYKVFFVCLLGGGLLAAGLNIKRQGWFLFAVALTLSAFGLRYARMVALTGFGMSLVLAVSLANFTWARFRPRFTDAAACVIAALACGFFIFSEDRGPRLLISGNPLHNSVPQKAVSFLKTLPPGNIFNEWSLGGYLAWELDGRQKIAAHGFISDPRLVKQHIYRFSVSREGWNEIVLAGDVRYFFLRRQTFEESRGAAWIEELNGPAWQNIYADGAAIIFLKSP